MDNTVASILLVEDDQSLCQLLEEELCDAGHLVTTVHDVPSALQVLASTPPDLVISDVRLPGADGLSLLEQIRREPAPPGVILITAFGTVPQAVDALKLGADDFITKPVDLDHLNLSVVRVLETLRLRRQVLRLQQILDDDGFHGILGQSPPMQRLFNTVRQVACADGPVLVSGESGVGKELVARALHVESPRAHNAFVAVNCAGIPPDLFESEFFGHAAGAFTGAQRDHQGLFRQADGGTLLLDEIAEMPLTMQAKLLRILQDGLVRPVGGSQETSVDVRIIAATNRDLEREVAEGRFREDLFFRLETFGVFIPPLRERGDDIELLTAHFTERFSARNDRRIEHIAPDALAQLKRYPFPGNVRELRSAIERAVVFGHEPTLRLSDLPPRIAAYRADHDSNLLQVLLNEGELPSLQELEWRYIQFVLQRVQGNKQQAANLLGIGRRTLYRRLTRDEHDAPD